MRAKHLNQHRPWLPQAFPPPQIPSKALGKEIARAKKDLQKASKSVSVLRLRHMALQKKLVGPYTVDMIVLTGQYERAKQERRIVMQKLQRMLTLRRMRRKK